MTVLQRALADVIEGEVRFSNGDRALYATDASNYRQVPAGVVIPRHTDDVIAAVRIAREHDMSVLMRGGGTSLAGQCCNSGLVLDLSKYVHGVLDVDRERRTARVLPGTYLDDLRDEAEAHGLTFGPDPATHNHCTIGGMIGNDSCGVHSVMTEFYGDGPQTSHNLVSLDVLTYDGTRMRVGPTDDAAYERILAEGGRPAEIHRALRALAERYGDLIRERFPRIQRRVSGYNLPALLPENGFNVAQALAGSECTCATILEAEVKLVEAPGTRVLLVLGYPSVYEAGDAVPTLREHRPIGLEGMDDVLEQYMRRKGLREASLDLFPEGGGWLLAEFSGNDRQEAVDRARAAMQALRDAGHNPSMRLYDDPEDQHRVWKVRESGLGATAFVPGERDTWPGWEDSAVPVDRVGDYLRNLRQLLEKHGYNCSLYGHFGQGCIHTRIDFDLGSEAGRERYRAFTREAAELVVRLGGSLSGEHGDGLARGDLLPLMYGPELMDAFREFKAIWDPAGRMNPGKVIDTEGRTAHLRLGAEHSIADPETRFGYAEDEGSFAHASLRCVGVGECRRDDGGVMCPSYMVLREEKHTTRGRAHLLHEMLRGEVITDGWKSEEVKESLDLCLACKGCTGECPVHVDIPTYKAEFLHRYYAGRMRPRAAWAFGLIDVWARAAARMPRVANALAQAPVFGSIGKWMGGIAPERDLPRFAERTFRERFARRSSPPVAGGTRRRDAPADRRPAVLWPDTFNNHFHPDVLVAATGCLEAIGFDVTLPADGLCCGRPLYDWGMLDRAERYLRRILDSLRPALEAGVPIVGVEPSCVAVFRTELPNLIRDDPAAQQLAGSAVTLGELLVNEQVEVPCLDSAALVHGHCHHRSVLGFDGEAELLKGVLSDVDVPDSGCCGMAGAFGFEAEKYDVSVAAGERVLLPAVREAAEDTLIVTDGFSCREQIAQQTDRRALHSAEVLLMALTGERHGNHRW